MSAKHHLNTYNRRRAIGPLEAGQNFINVVMTTGVSKSISQVKQTAEDGNSMQMHVGGRGRINIYQKYRYASLVTKKNKNVK